MNKPAAVRARRINDRRHNMREHVRDVFQRTLERRGLQVRLREEDDQAGNESILWVTDKQGVEHHLVVWTSYRDVHVTVRRPDSSDAAFVRRGAFFSWSSKELPGKSRQPPKRAALLLAKKIEAAPLYEIHED